MPASLLNDISLYLESNSIGVIGTNLFYGNMPDSPDSCTCVLSASGSVTIHSNATVVIVSVLIRGKDYSLTYDLSRAVYDLLHNKQNLLSGVTGVNHIIGFSRMDRAPLHIGKDPQSRHLWSLAAEMNTTRWGV